MIVGTLEFEVLIREAQSLKDKRRAIKSLKDRIRHRFPVSIAEVDALDHWQRSVLGACKLEDLDGAGLFALMLAVATRVALAHVDSQLSHADAPWAKMPTCG